MKRSLLGMIGLLWLVGVAPSGFCNSEPLPNAQPPDSSRLSLHVDASGFFIDNEFYGSALDGYTLPGFLLRPRAVWHVVPRVSLEAGFHWLHFWGAQGFPSGPFLDPWTAQSPTAVSSSVHLLPWLRAEARLHDSILLTAGSLHREHRHELPLPLYNPERLYSTDPEAGIQLRLDWGHWSAEVWTDWQQFAWRNGTLQERFVFGTLAAGRINTAHGWSLRLPLHLLAIHHGGQGLAATAPSGTRYNAATALCASFRSSLWTYDAACYAVASFEHASPSSGWGLFPTLRLDYTGTAAMEAGFWHGHRFSPLLGLPLFATLPPDGATSTSPVNQMATVAATLTWQRFSACSVHAHGRYYHRFGHKHPAQFSFGLSIDINPVLPLLR